MQLNMNISRDSLSPLQQYVYMFGLTLVIQFFHMVEHVAQVMQKFIFEVPAHGLIGQLDIEQVHFSFNLFYLATLIYITLGWLNFGGHLSRREKLLGGLLIGTVIVQTYHTIEHTVKLFQFIATGMQGTPGILGNIFDGVIFHAVMNTGVFLPVVIVFFLAGLQRYFWKGNRF